MLFSIHVILLCNFLLSFVFCAVKLLSSLLMCRVDRHPCIGNIKHKYNSDLNWMWTSPHPVMLKKLWSASGTYCLGTFWPTDLGTFWPYTQGTLWFGDVLTGHQCYVHKQPSHTGKLRLRSVYSHDRRVLTTPVGYSHDDQSEAR